MSFSVADASGSAKGFKPGSGGDYLYDANGNLTTDPNKGMAVQYNHLNLPKLFTFAGGGQAGTVEVRYDAAGKKLQKKVKTGTTLNYTQDYLGGIEYRDTVREAIYHAEGRVFYTGPATTRYEYAIRDYLGNTRLTFTDKNANGVVDMTDNPATNEVLQENHYYPFGLNTEGPWTNDAAQDNRYQYNGKEWSDDHGLNWYDYGARWYDAAVGRWNAVDPLCGKMVSFSTYNYGFNNPIRFIDVGGLAPSDPPNGNVSWVWFTPVEKGGKYFKQANYQNVSAKAASEWNQYNMQNDGNGGAITKTTHDYLATGENHDAVGYEVPDPAGGEQTTDETKAGAGVASFSIGLPRDATEANVSISYDFFPLADNLDVSVGDKNASTGNQVDTNGSPLSVNNAKLDKGSKSIAITITPMSPNPLAGNRDPLRESHWEVKVNYSTNAPVYSSSRANSTRPNSSSGEVLGGYRKE